MDFGPGDFFHGLMPYLSEVASWLGLPQEYIQKWRLSHLRGLNGFRAVNRAFHQCSKLDASRRVELQDPAIEDGHMKSLLAHFKNVRTVVGIGLFNVTITYGALAQLCSTCTGLQDLYFNELFGNVSIPKWRHVVALWSNLRCLALGGDTDTEFYKNAAVPEALARSCLFLEEFQADVEASDDYVTACSGCRRLKRLILGMSDRLLSIGPGIVLSGGNLSDAGVLVVCKSLGRCPVWKTHGLRTLHSVPTARWRIFC
ncbi:unnamed protein product [Prorocentrum cordatum]|uniref:Uncharacterized protein n=1 Tax=Prorocentrum cordatum TaxID=2364126 RepID=A0ABN9PR61_9DINO|nr:unnamed protein product [Polarella glacialis]